MGYGGKQANRSGDVRRFNFTGNGSNTAFDLGFTPATQNQLIVTVNGLVQHYDAFSISGSTLTFTGTPASGDTIQVTAVVDAVGVAAIPDGAVANVSTLTVSGAATLANTFAVTGNAVFSNTVAITGNTTFSNTTAHTGAATFSNTVTVANSGITFGDASTQTTAATGFGFKNRIINGDMRIDQRYAGANVALTTSYGHVIDRWYFNISQNSKLSTGRNQGSVTLPAGFVNYMGITSAAAYTPSASENFEVTQNIEGFNIADFAWGTSSAKAIAVSFWVRSSLTGTFGGCIQNDGNTRSYPFSYAVSSANTWEQKTVTVAGCTDGTWNSDNTGGMKLRFNLGNGSNFLNTAGTWYSGDYRGVTGNVNIVGTNGATLYITGVQLEKGSTATTFDYRDFNSEIVLCERYYQKSYNLSVVPGTNEGSSGSGNISWRNQDYSNARSTTAVPVFYRTALRAVPTVTIYSLSGSSGNVTNGGDPQSHSSNISTSAVYGSGCKGFAGLEINAVPAGQYANFHYTASAEL